MPEDLTIVQIASYYPPSLGGLERVVQEIAEQLARDRHRVMVLTSNVNAKNLPRVEGGPYLTIRRLWAINFAHTAFMPGLLWQLFRVRKPAVFHLHLAQAYVPEIVWLTAKMRGIPYVVHFHLDVERSGKLGFIFVWWKRWVQPLVIKDAARVIVLSPEQAKLIHERYHKPVDQIDFISNGVGDQFLNLGRAKRDFHKPMRLLFVGRLHMQKRPERLIEALSLIKSDVTLNVVGEGDDRMRLESLVAKLKLTNVVFSGRLYDQKLLAAYQNADVFVLPSDREGMPLVLLEAMATGLPIIGSDVLGIHELIKGIGVLVKNPSPQTFAEAIDGLACNPEELSKLNAASSENAKKYSWKKLVEKLESVYGEITK
jgi:phosphatidylinositol alpha-mannosyltransferase